MRLFTYYKVSTSGNNIQQSRYYQATYMNYIIKSRRYIRKGNKEIGKRGIYY